MQARRLQHPGDMDLLDPPDALIQKYLGAVPRYTSYPPVPAWGAQIGPADYDAQLIRLRGGPTPLSVYVHIPFCRAQCSYCGCNVVIRNDRRVADGYLDSLSQEIAHAAERLGPGQRVTQLHWGGGTPNFLTEEQMIRLAGDLERWFPLAEGAEAAVELNPATCTRSQLECLRRLGFNRVSFGVQDLDPVVQRAVHRAPVGPRLRELVDTARGLGFRGINFDLIYGLPHQSVARWERTLDQVVEISPDRLAIYAFAFLPDALPHQRGLDGAAMPTGPAKLDLFRRAYRRLVAAGYRSIGMDHFAREEDELSRAQERGALRRNFQGYTASAATHVIAFGASAISDLDGLYAQNVHALDRYASAVSAGSFATHRGLRLSAEDLQRREMIQQLMCNLRAPFGPAEVERFAAALERLQVLEADGLVRLEGDEIRVTPLGRFFVRNVAQALDAYSVTAGHAAAGV